MTCNEIRPELIAYHFGTASDDVRAAIESHLVGCTECLKAFLAIKREIECDPAGPRPSAHARTRLRNAVATELRRQHGPRAWSWWERPLAFSVAAAATVVAVITTHALTSGHGSMPHGMMSAMAHAQGAADEHTVR